MSAPGVMKAGLCNASRTSTILTTSVRATRPKRTSAGSDRPAIRRDRTTAVVTTMQLAARSIYDTAPQEEIGMQKPPQLLPTKLEEGQAPGVRYRIDGELVPVLHTWL